MRFNSLFLPNPDPIIVTTLPLLFPANDPTLLASEVSGLELGLVPAPTPTLRTIPGFDSYRTIEATYADLAALAAAHPDLATWVDIGDSYDKVTPGGAAGYDIFALQLGKVADPIDEDPIEDAPVEDAPIDETPEEDPAEVAPPAKPVLFIQGSIHGLDYVTTELATRFAETLVANYGINPDATWLLDYFDIRIVPVLNPDGRKLAEAGNLWRKNANPTVPIGQVAAPFPNYGVNLDRNFAVQWENPLEVGITDPAHPGYRGSVAFSEPETQALRDYLTDTFAARPDPTLPGFDTAGVFIDLRSAGNEILYPDRWSLTPAPDYTGLRSLGLKLGYYTTLPASHQVSRTVDPDSTLLLPTTYDVKQASGRSLATGTAIDWVYQTFGVATYMVAAGTQPFEPSENFEQLIAPQLLPALTYAAKAAYRPYQVAQGPDVQTIQLSSTQAIAGLTTTVNLSVTVSASQIADGNGTSLSGSEGLTLPEPAIVTGARFSINAPSWIPDTPIVDLFLASGDYDSPIETFVGAIDTSSLAPGRYTIFAEGLDAWGNYGVPSAIFLDVLEAPANASILRGTELADSWTTDSKPYLVLAREGDDQIQTNAGTDLILAGAGSDQVNSGGQNDQVYGGGEDDEINGGDGEDRLFGESGNDQLVGGLGNDLLWGGQGEDILVGGDGADIFALVYGEGVDTITDFEVGVDRIGLVGNLRFAQLTITSVDNTLLVSVGKLPLVELLGLESTDLTAASFASVPTTGNLTV